MGQPKRIILNWPHIKMDKNFQILSQAINLQNSNYSLHFAEYLMLSIRSQNYSRLYLQEKEKKRYTTNRNHMKEKSLITQIKYIKYKLNQRNNNS